LRLQLIAAVGKINSPNWTLRLDNVAVWRETAGQWLTFLYDEHDDLVDGYPLGVASLDVGVNSGLQQGLETNGLGNPSIPPDWLPVNPF